MRETRKKSLRKLAHEINIQRIFFSAVKNENLVVPIGLTTYQLLASSKNTT